MLKHYQQVGRTEHGMHPKDADVRVNERGEVLEIIEGEFLNIEKPDYEESMAQREALAS